MSLDLTHIHLLLNHLPVIGTGAGLFFLLWGVIRKSAETTRAALVALVLVALITPAAFYTGEPAEKRVENLPGVSKPAIESHEEAADAAFVSVIVVGILSLLALIVRRGARAGAVSPVWLVVAATIVSGILFARAANLGGKVRHSEIAGGAAAIPAAQENGEVDD